MDAVLVNVIPASTLLPLLITALGLAAGIIIAMKLQEWLESRKKERR